MVTTDLWRVVSKAFSARRAAALQSAIDYLGSDLLGDLDGGPVGEVVDLRTRLAYLLPVGVVG